MKKWILSSTLPFPKLPNEKHASDDDWDDYESVNDPASGKKLPNEGHASDDDWDDYESVNDPASGKKLPNEGHASDDDWDDYESVNDPASGKKLPNEGHASDDDWDDYESVNDPASGKKLPNEGHASDDDWDDYESVNDPASGKKLPNEGHAFLRDRLMQRMGLATAPSRGPIYVTEKFKRDIVRIYGRFTSTDNEYPAMGITIQGAPIFVECVRFPDCAVVRRRFTDEVRREDPAVGRLWESKLRQYSGKCRTSTVHIHPMNLAHLSGTDISNFDSLRTNPNDPSTFGRSHPYPVILINLNAGRTLSILGFWVKNGRADKVEVVALPDDSTEVVTAWREARRMPFFSEEASITQQINQLVSKEWVVELGHNSKNGKNAIKAVRSDGERVMVLFENDSPLGLQARGTKIKRFAFENYVDWTRMFNDLIKEERAAKRKKISTKDRVELGRGEFGATVESPVALPPRQPDDTSVNRPPSATRTITGNYGNGSPKEHISVTA